jgi:hypothetical protein
VPPKWIAAMSIDPEVTHHRHAMDNKRAVDYLKT